MPAGTAVDPAVIGREQRLSGSLVWELQRRWFAREGVEAWRTHTVPHYATNNPALAHAYAEVVHGLLRDLHAAGPPDLCEALTIVELGAASGRFAYLFLVALRRLRQGTPLASFRVRYVLTDIVEKNLAFARAHHALRPFVEEGDVDFALFDAERDTEIRLLGAGETLSPGALRHPLVLIANYVFDAVSQDAFTVRDGALHEHLVTVRGGQGFDPDDADGITRIEMEYTDREAPPEPYGDPVLDGLLRACAARLDDATFLFPVTALRCLRALARLSDGRLAVLSSDRGTVRADEVPIACRPTMAHHGGSFSMPVNYHALAAYAALHGGLSLTAALRSAQLATVTLLLGDHPSGWAEARAAHAEAFARVGPDDIFSLRRGIQDHYRDLSPQQIAALVRLSRYDPRVLRDCLPALWPQIGAADEATRRELAELVRQVWENHYDLGEDRDLAFDFAILLHGLADHAGAIAFFAESTRRHGDDPRTRWNVGLCHAAMGQAGEAARCFAEAMTAGLTPERALLAKDEAGAWLRG